MSDVISISLEETNKLRVSLGLKPIEPELRKLQAPVALLVTVKKSKSTVLEKIPQLELDGAELDDTDDWLGRLSAKKTSESSLVVVVPTLEEEREDDLKGVKIGHSIQDIANLKDGAVFTLKDRSILDDGDDDNDELEEETLIEKQRVKENLKVKLGRDRQKFKGYDQEETEEDIQDGHFVLTGNKIDISTIKSLESEQNLRTNKRKITILGDDDFDETGEEVLKDYQDTKPVKMKKMKKMAAKHMRSKTNESDADKDLKYVELAKDQDNVADDYELVSALSLLRKKALQKRKVSPEEFVLQRVKGLKIEEEEENFESGLVIDETMEFLNSLKEEPVISKPVKKEESSVKLESIAKEIPAKVEEETSIPNVKKEEYNNAIPLVKQEEDASFVAEQEENLSSGLGSTLKMLQQRSILNKQDSHAKEVKQKQRELLKLKEMLDLKKQNLSKSDVDQLEKIEREQQQLLKNYDPVVHISYHDDKGNTLSTKEAYKHLSHQFHGKAPSNNKMGKLFKKRQLGNQ